jgi:hypothetical protein
MFNRIGKAGNIINKKVGLLKNNPAFRLTGQLRKVFIVTICKHLAKQDDAITTMDHKV